MKSLRELSKELGTIAPRQVGELPVMVVNWELTGDCVESIEPPELVEIGELRSVFGADLIESDFSHLPDSQLVWVFNYK
jgi:hypothetical protein